MTRIMVTGASGLLGSKIVRLAMADHEVIPTHHTRPLFRDSVQLDITDRDRVLKVISRLRPDVVIHAAAQTNVDRCELNETEAWRINAEGTKNVAEACARIGAKVVYLSSVAGDTPVLVRRAGSIRSVPIRDLYRSASADCEVLTLGRDHRLGFKGVRLVTAHPAHEVYEIRYGGGGVVRTSGSHSVYVFGDNGIAPTAVSGLRVGDALVTCLGAPTEEAKGLPDGGIGAVRVKRVIREVLSKPIWLYDIHVPGVQRFFGGDVPVLLHNTDYVFDGAKGMYTEDEEPRPVNCYGRTKLEGEGFVKACCEDYVIARASVLYGWHPWKPNFAAWVIGSLRRGKPISVVVDHYNSPTFADNLARALLEIVGRDVTGVYHTAGAERISRFDFAVKAARVFGLDDALIRPIKMEELRVWVARRPRDSSLSVDKALRGLGIELLDATKGLLEMKREEAGGKP